MSLPEGFTIRCASTADLETLVEHRRAMFQDMGYSDEAAMRVMSEKFRVWLLEHINAGDYLAWLATAPDGTISAGTGLWLMDWPPHMIGRGRRGNILNVYTNANFRRRGLARALMQSGAGLVQAEQRRHDNPARQSLRTKSLRIDGLLGHQRDATAAVVWRVMRRSEGAPPARVLCA